MIVIVPPALVRDRLCRIVAPVPTLLEVEEWTGAWWEPSSLTLREVSSAPLASHALLLAHAVPREEWGTAITPVSAQTIEAMMRAHVVERDTGPHSPTPPVRRTDEDAARRKRPYPGSARFGNVRRKPRRDAPPG